MPTFIFFQNKEIMFKKRHGRICIFRTGSEPTNSVLKRSRTSRSLDCWTTATNTVHCKVECMKVLIRNTRFLTSKPFCLLQASCWFIVPLVLPWRWRRHVPPKRPMNFNGLHGIIAGHGLRHVLSSLARKPGSCVRIPLRAWMFSVSVCESFSVFLYR
jgi:hypothetical protein